MADSCCPGWIEYMFVTGTQPIRYSCLGINIDTKEYHVCNSQRVEGATQVSVAVLIVECCGASTALATWISTLTHPLTLVLYCPPHFSNLYRTFQETFLCLYQPESISCITTKTLYPCCYKTKTASMSGHHI